MYKIITVLSVLLLAGCAVHVEIPEEVRHTTEGDIYTHHDPVTVIVTGNASFELTPSMNEELEEYLL